MKNDEFFNMCQKYCNKCLDLMGQKGDEYSRNNDKLHNFKSAAAFDDCEPELALWGMWLKHIISVKDFLHDLRDGISHPIDKWDEKLMDMINYTLLLRALLLERYGNPCRKGFTDEDYITIEKYLNDDKVEEE